MKICLLNTALAIGTYCSVVAAPACSYARVVAVTFDGALQSGKIVHRLSSAAKNQDTVDYTNDATLGMVQRVTGVMLVNGCTEIEPGTMKTPRKNPDKFGTWSVANFQDTYGSCPGTYTYAGIYYDWTKSAKIGKQDKVATAIWSAKYQGVKYVTKNVITNVLTAK